MPFAIDIRQWKTIEDFSAHLKLHNPEIANWVKGIVIHHTYRPLQSQWNGKSTMDGLKKYYQSLGWDAGPHLFIVANSKNPNDDGIWQLTPLNMVGIHAGICNSSTWGIEVVGDYDNVEWDKQTKELVIGAIGELAKWNSISINPSTLKGHRDCNSPKTCPGKKIDMNTVRVWTNEYIAKNITENIVTSESMIQSSPRCSIEQACSYILNKSYKTKLVYSPEDIQLSIIPAYWNYCLSVGVDPCIVVAQMIHETGNLSSWWCERPRRNPAGIGVTGEQSINKPNPEDLNKWARNDDTNKWQKGVSFPNWQESVIAHVGRIVAYATNPSNRTVQQQELVTKALFYRTLPLHLHGIAPTIRGLNGTWAYPGTHYSDKISLIANGIINQ